jgi:hypothetical protein
VKIFGDADIGRFHVRSVSSDGGGNKIGKGMECRFQRSRHFITDLLCTKPGAASRQKKASRFFRRGQKSASLYISFSVWW